MLPVELEKKILCGKAQWRHDVIGMSGNMFLPVASDGYIVITNITTFHFLNGQSGVDYPQNLGIILSQLAYQIKVKSANNEHTFICKPDLSVWRDTAGIDGSLLGSGEMFSAMPAGHTSFDTYIVCPTDVIFNVSMQMPANLISDLDYGAVTDGAADDRQPSGYAGMPASQNIDLGDAQSYYIPLTRKGNRSAVINRRYLEKLIFPIRNESILRQNDSPDYAEDEFLSFSVPYLNISYVKINEPLNKHIM